VRFTGGVARICGLIDPVSLTARTAMRNHP